MMKISQELGDSELSDDDKDEPDYLESDNGGDGESEDECGRGSASAHSSSQPKKR